MAETKTTVLDFSQGISREFDSDVAQRSARFLRNWHAEPDGGLRVRPRWRRGSTLSAPGTRDVLGFELYPAFSGFENPVLRQRRKRSKKGTNVTSIKVPWLEPTLDGAGLVAILTWTSYDSSWNDGTITPKTHTATSTVVVDAPDGWTSAGVVHHGTAPSAISMQMFVAEGAVSREGYEEFFFEDVSEDPNPMRRATVVIMEWWGVERIAAALDEVADNSGTSAAPSTDMPAVGGQDKEVFVAAIAGFTADDSIKLGNLSPGWMDYRDSWDYPHSSVGRANQYLNLAVASRLVSDATTERYEFAGTYDTSEEEDDASSRWVGMALQLKAHQRNNDTDYWVALQKVDAEQAQIYYADRQMTDEDDLTVPWASSSILPDSSDIEAFRPMTAHGLGVILVVRKDRRIDMWDGANLLTLRRSPRAKTVAFYRQRFFAGNTEDYPARLYYTPPHDPTYWNIEVGQRVAETNEPSVSTGYLDVGNDGDPINDVNAVLDGLLIGKERGLHFLTGYGPMSFSLTEHGGGAMQGRSICSFPGGALVVAEQSIFLFDGGEPQLISKPLDNLWEPPVWASTAYCNGKCYVVGANEVFVYDIVSQSWATEQVDGDVRVVFSVGDNIVMFGPNASNEWSLLNYQKHPDDRQRDDLGVMHFRAETQQLLLADAAHQVSPMHLYVGYQQRFTNTGEQAPRIIPVYNGVEYPARELTQHNDDGDFHERIDIGEQTAEPVHKVQFIIEHTVEDTYTTMYDIEQMALIFDVEEAR